MRLICVLYILFGYWSHCVVSYLRGANASVMNHRQRMSALYGESFHFALQQRKATDLNDFRLTEGYVSATLPDMSVAFSEYDNKAIAYSCGDVFPVHSNVTIRGNISNTTFNGTYFLSLLRNKVLTFVGDSLARQAFLDLSAELSPYQTMFLYENSNLSISSTSNIGIGHFDKECAREYGGFNATIRWCEDGTLSHFVPPEMPYPCQLQSLHSDVLVFGVGSWYKPFFTQVLHPDYYNDMELQYKQLLSTVSAYRASVHARIAAFNQSTSPMVIWQLVPHVGMVDELRAYDPEYETRTQHFHTDGRYWSNLTLGALWPPFYNQAIRNIAHRFHDSVLDTYKLSVLFHERIEKRWRVHGLGKPEKLERLHIDSLHYCPGSIFRAQNYLLQVAVEEKLHSYRYNRLNSPIVRHHRSPLSLQ